MPIAFGLVVAALAMFFTLTGNMFYVFVLLPLAMMIWFVFLRPTHRAAIGRPSPTCRAGSCARVSDCRGRLAGTPTPAGASSG